MTDQPRQLDDIFSEPYENRSPDGEGPAGAPAAVECPQLRAGSNPADSLPLPPRGWPQLEAALRRIYDDYGDCRCDHDDEHCCAFADDYCCPTCIAAHALGLASFPLSDPAVTPPDPAPRGWQAIETAPKEDSVLVLLYPSRCWCEESDRGEFGYWDEYSQEWVSEGPTAEDYTGPTHWMPCPLPPNKENS